MKRSTPRRSRALRLGGMKVALLLFSVVLALGLGELLVRAVAPQKLYRFPRGVFVNDPDLQVRLAPNYEGRMTTTEYRATIRTNAAGFREDRDYGPPDAGTVRILAVGDSFTMGVGVDVEQSFLKLLESRLAAAVAADVEVINAGVPGYNTAQEAGLLERVHGRLQPDLVLLHFYVGNDVHDNLKPPQSTVVDGFVTSGTAAPTLLPRGLRQWLQRRSHLYGLLWPIQRAIRDRSFTEARRLAQIEHWRMYETGSDDSTAALWDATATDLEAVADFHRRSGINLVVVVIPEPIQVSASAWQEAAPETETTEFPYRREFPDVKIADLCRDLGLPVLDLLPAFEAVDSAASMYFPLDGHWTPRGNALAAEAIARFLLDRPALLDSARRRGIPEGASSR